jgi:hypothetical protein
VDDIIVTGSSTSAIRVLQDLRSNFALKDSIGL